MWVETASIPRIPNLAEAGKPLLRLRKNCSCVSGTSAIHGGRPENCSCVSGTSAIHGGRYERMGCGFRFTRAHRERQMEADEQAAARHRAGLEKGAALQVDRSGCREAVHAAPPLVFSSTACLMARRTRE